MTLSMMQKPMSEELHFKGEINRNTPKTAAMSMLMIYYKVKDCIFWYAFRKAGQGKLHLAQHFVVLETVKFISETRP